MDVFKYLEGTKWSDNLCTVGWSCIWARRWDQYSIDAAMRYCPRGYFISTAFIGSDERRAWKDEQWDQNKQFGAPIHVLHRGAYFSFPLDRGALQLMQAVGLVDECMVMAASGGRFPFPDDAFNKGGLPLCTDMDSR